MGRLQEILMGQEAAKQAEKEKATKAEQKNLAEEAAAQQKKNDEISNAAREDVKDLNERIRAIQTGYDRQEGELISVKADYLARIRKLGELQREAGSLFRQANETAQHISGAKPATISLQCELEHNTHDPQRSAWIDSKAISNAWRGR